MTHYFLATFVKNAEVKSSNLISVLGGLSESEANILKKKWEQFHPDYNRVIFDEEKWVEYLCKS